MSRLIVVSNRVSVPKARGAAGSQGGLAVALGSALRERRGIWFGWSGNETKKFSGHLDMQKNHGVTTATIDLEPQDVDEYYNGYANRTLWPLFHYRIDLAEYESGFGKGYERVNQRFADSLGPLIDPEDVVWVHDYQLFMLGMYLRQAGWRGKLGYFLHVPFPASDIFSILPWAAEILESLVSYDLIGVHTVRTRADAKRRFADKDTKLEYIEPPGRMAPTYDSLVKKVADYGYDISKLRKVPQQPLDQRDDG